MLLYLMKIIYSAGTGWGEPQVEKGAKRRQQTPKDSGVPGWTKVRLRAVGRSGGVPGMLKESGPDTKTCRVLESGCREGWGWKLLTGEALGKLSFSLFGPRSVEN